MPRVLSDYDRLLGSKLRQIREGQGMLPLHLARAIGVSHTTLASYELGHLRMKPARIKRAADALNVKIEEFLTVIPDDELQTSFVEACRGIKDDQVLAMLHQAVTEVLKAEEMEGDAASPEHKHNGQGRSGTVRSTQKRGTRL